MIDGRLRIKLMKKSISVCHLTSAHKRYDQRILYRQCISLQENGYKVTLGVNDSLDDEIYKGIVIKSTRRDYTGKRFWRMIFGVRSIYSLAKKVNADIYELHDPELLLIAGLLKRSGKKVIFDSHESYYDQIKTKEYLPKWLRSVVAGIYRVYESKVAKKIDGVMMPTTINGANVFKGRVKKFTFINNVPRLENFPLEKEGEGRREGICYAGGLTYDRGITMLMKAAYKAKVTLYLAGEFSPKSYYETLMKEKESKIIKYEGVLKGEDVYKLYRNCAIGMCTLLDVGQYSKGNNLSTKVYEYMAMGLPVILSDFPYNRKMIEKYQFGLLVNPENPNDIAAKIGYLLKRPEEAARFGENGRKLVTKKLNWSVEERKLLKFYLEL